MNTDAILSLLHQSISYYVGFNLFLLFGFIYNRVVCNLIRDWPSVSGTVIQSRLDSNFRAGKYENRSSVSPLISYTYEVNGETYTNQRIAPGFNITGKYVLDMVRSFPVGSQVTVYYMPDGPTVSFLSKKSLIEPYLLTYFILGNLLMPFIVMIFGLVSFRNFF